MENYGKTPKTIATNLLCAANDPNVAEILFLNYINM